MDHSCERRKAHQGTRPLGALRHKVHLRRGPFYLRRTYVTYRFLFNIIKFLYLFPILCLYSVIFGNILAHFLGFFVLLFLYIKPEQIIPPKPEPDQQFYAQRNKKKKTGAIEDDARFDN